MIRTLSALFVGWLGTLTFAEIVFLAHTIPRTTGEGVALAQYAAMFLLPAVALVIYALVLLLPRLRRKPLPMHAAYGAALGVALGLALGAIQLSIGLL